MYAVGIATALTATAIESHYRVSKCLLYAGLIRLHVLHHAVREPVYWLAMIEELGRHGYKLSAGTLYPILHGLEERGYLTSTEERSGSVARRTRGGDDFDGRPNAPALRHRALA